MQPITNLLINSVHKAIKFLQRDFLELEMLQVSSTGNSEFCKKSYSKLKSLLQNELHKYTEFLFFPEDKFDINSINAELVFLINPIDSIDNLTRSLPFFSLSIVALKKVQKTLIPVSTIIYSLAFNEIYYAEKGRGAWVEKSSSNSINQNNRVRVSGNNNLKNALIAVDSPNNIFLEKQNIRIFGSNCYAIALLACGKIDIVYLSSLDYILNYAFELMIKEAGGSVMIAQNKFIYSNSQLEKKIKDLVQICGN